jgi:signal peptidase I
LSKKRRRKSTENSPASESAEARPGQVADESGEPTWRKSALRENFESIAVAVLFAMFVRGFIAQPYKIPSGSMEENLLVGDHLVVNKVLYGAGSDQDGPAFLPTHSVSRGDVVIFRPPHAPETDYIKRVIGLPGEQLRVLYQPRRNSVRVFIDGKALPESYRLEPGGDVTEAEEARWTVNCTGDPPERAVFSSDGRLLRPPHFSTDKTYELGPDEYFVMGDNRNDSMDSRAWGDTYAVEGRRIRGKALFIYWSYNSEGGPQEPTGNVLSRLGFYGKIALGFFPRTRWSRFLHPI